MKTRLLRSLFFGCLGLCKLAIAAPACGGHGDQATMLVTTAWLADHLQDPNLVILAVGKDGDYETGHIPGSLFVKYGDTYLHQNESGLHVELPPMPDLVEEFGKLGVTNDSHVILYQTNDWYTAATRIYLTLDAMGLGRHTSILDGGLPVWKKEGRAVTTDTPTVKRGKLEPCPQNDIIADLGFVKSNLRHPGVDIVDVRTEASYVSVEASSNSRAGHIPGASSLPFEKLVDDTGKLKPVAELRALLSGAGIKPGDRVVSYCYIGQRATAVYFVARYLGYDARLYDGSWEEWNKHTELPTEISATK